MVPRAWTIDELRATLLAGARLPGEPTGEPPWPRCMDDEYRRITAASCLASDYADDPECVGILHAYVTDGENQEVRCRCLTLLGEISPLGELIDQLLDDPEPEIRLYSLEYMLVNHPSRFPELESRFQEDQDWQINETLACFRAGTEIPLFHYHVPANKPIHGSGEVGRSEMDDRSSRPRDR